MQDQFLITIIAAVFISAAIFMVFVGFMIVRPWLRAFLNAAPISFICVLAMRIRGNPPILLIDTYISLKHAGIAATISEVEVVYIENRNRIANSDDLVELVKEFVVTCP
ncbi:MAG: flotillin-like FloA family protein [Planctomycetaceae bacterium]|nr:flotillin-like FloA family protein [Planctomycetaceae bacterium]